MDDMDFWEWLAKVFLDGIGGGLLGGLVAWLLLRRTITNEKTQREADAKAADLGELRRAVAKLYERAGELPLRTPGMPMKMPAKGVLVDLVAVESLMRKHNPDAADEFLTHRRHLLRCVSPDSKEPADRIRELAGRIEISCIGWLDSEETLMGAWPER